jgi:tape measure domain-containing protein
MADAAQLKLQVGLDLTFFRQQLAQLGKELARLSKLKTVISINDSQVTAATDRVDSLNKAIVALRNAAKNPIIVETKYKATGDVPGARTKAKSAVNTAVKGQSLVDNASRTELQSLYKFAKESNLQFEKLQRGAASKTEELRRVLGPAFSNVGSDILAGIKSGLADANSALSKIAAGMGATLIGKTKAVFGIASPSKVFKAIGENIVDGLEIGFIDGLKDFKNKSVDEIRKIVALLKLELAKISGVSMAPAMTRSAGGRGSQGYMSPIGPLPHGSREPWAFSEGRYQPFMTQPGQMRGASASRAGGPSIMGTISSPSMFGAGFPALPSAGMTTGGSSYRQAQLQSRVAAAYARSAAREASVLGEGQMYASVSGRVPLGNTAPRLPAGNRGGALALRDTGAQTPLSLDYYKNAFKYSEALKVADASMRNFSASQIPFIGGLRGVAGELGQATKQVLLYGTAYRALAAITSIPGQILNAAKSQQQYTNGLKVATQETGTFAKELLFVDNVQRAFGLNLETTRTGFTRLYASMAPTGFDSGSIEKLFTGISAATAALQLTPDKAERVIYAFGQMASKGQIMSEELKGQLGDVLPGALAIFAKSAGMSVKEFSKAMEDGEFVGSRFREVFAKVSDELMTRFGTGAQAAGKSLQGLLSTVGGDFQRTLESFAPLANNVAQAILVPLGGALRQLSTSAQIAMGEMDRVKGQYQAAKIDLGDLRAGGASADQIRAAEQNVAALEARYKSLNKALEDPAIAKQVKDIQLFTQELTKAGIFVMNVAKAIGGILSPVINFLGTNLTATIATITSFYIGFQAARLAAMALMGVLLLYRGLSAMLGLSTAAQQATALSGAFNVLGVSASRANVALIGTRVALTALVAATVVGAVVAGIVAIASAFATMGDKARDAAQASKDAGKAAMDAASTGNVAGAEMGVQAVLAESRKNTAARKALEAIQRRSTVDQRKGAVPMSITSEESVALQGSALTAGMIKAGVSRGGVRQIQALTKELMDTTLKQFGSLAGQAAIDLKEAKSAVNQARKVSVETGLNKPTPNPLTEDEDTKKKQNLESYYKLGDDLSKMRTAADIDRATAVFDFQADRINALYDMQEARANSFQKASIQFQREMFNIEMQRQKANLDAQNQITKAQGSVARGGDVAGAYLQGNIGPTSTGPHFDVKKVGGGYFDRKLLDKYVQVNGKPLSSGTTVGGGTFAAHQRRGSSGWDYAFGAGRQAATLMGGAQWLEGKPTAHGEQRRFQIPTGEQFQFLHGKSEGIGAIPPGKIAASQARTMKAELATNIAITKQHEIATRADEKALLDQQVAMQKYVSSIMPIAEQELQIQLLKKRSELTKSGISQEQIDTEMQIFETRTKSGIALKDYTRLIEQYENAVKTGDVSQGFANKAIAGFRAEIDKVNKGLPLTVEQIKELAAIQSTLKLDKAVQDLQNRLDMARALTPEAEMRTRLQQQGYAGAQLETLFETEKATTKAEELKTQMQGVASTIGDAFSTAFQGIINGSVSAQEALGNFFQSVGQSFVKMAMDIIAKQMTMIVLGFLMKALGLAGGASGGSSTFFGGGSPDAVAGGGLFTGAGPYQFPKAANGAIFSGDIAKFATGGIVNGPTLFPFADGGAMQMGLMGEAGPEAILPLQRGADGALGVRAAMGGNGMGGNSSPVLNMSFETSTINGVEYVSRDQLEAAMAQTRRQASRDGANKGMAMTLDKIQQSPQTRRRIGM